MANTRELRRRIKSVKNTSQITRAMQMVAAVKMRKAQDQATSGRPYSENLATALVRLLPRVETETHPLLMANESSKVGMILLSTDKGLVGALNTNVVRTVLASQLGNVVFYTVGRKGRSFVVRTGKELIADFENVDVVTFRQAVQLAKMITEAFLSSAVGEVYLIYPHFVSTIKQEARKVKLLPIELDVILGTQSEALRTPESKSKDSGQARMTGFISRDFLYEPNVDILIDALLIHHIQIKIYQALLETKASEHSARMVAMKNATDNALELIDDLTLTYNQTRQDSITKEILEIATAQVAIE